MDTRDDIAAIRRRLGALEGELAQLKLALERLEAESSAAAAPANASAAEPASVVAAPPPLPVVETAPAGDAAASPESARAIPEPAAPARPAAAPRPHPWREWLEPLQLWPPGGETNAEVRLAAWWATRLGALLAVIGVVFLGVYVSRNSPPWVRLAEVAGVTAGVLALGSWLDRKLPKFGAVVFGAGLALAYFCAFAAYAVPPMQVITSPFAATAGELVVVGGILVTAWRRNSQVIATMAIALGYVTAFLALRAGPVTFGSGVILLLGVAAVFLRFAPGWAAPSALAMPLTWLFLAACSVRGPGRDMTTAEVWAWSAIHFALFMARDWIGAWRGRALSPGDRALQLVNSGLATAVALLAGLRVDGPLLTGFFFVSGAIVFLTAWAWQRVRETALVPALVCKAAGLVALGLIDAFAGQTRALVLLAQAFVMLVSARQSRQRWLRTATVIVGAVALAFFASEIRGSAATFAARATLLEAVFLAGATALIGALHRWLDWGAGAAAVASAIVGAVAVAVVSTWHLPAWSPALHVALALGLGAAAAVVRGWLAAGIAGGIVLVAAHVAIWLFPTERLGRAALWWNELAVLAVGLVAAGALSRAAEARTQPLRWVLASLAGATLVVACFKGLDAPAALAATALLAVVLVAVAPAARSWPLAALAAPLLALGGGFFLGGGPVAASPWLWAAMAAAWAAPVWLVLSAARTDTLELRVRPWTPAAQSAAATFVTLVALAANLRHLPAGFVAGTTFAALAVFALAWRTPLSSALECSWVLWAAVLPVVVDRGASAAAWLAALAAWLPAVVLGRSPAAAPLRRAPPVWRAHAASLQVAGATVLGAVVALDCPGALTFAAFGAVAAVAFAVWRFAGVAAARPAVVALAAGAWLTAARYVAAGRVEGWGAGLGAVVAVATAVALLPFVLERETDRAVRRPARWTAAVAGLLLACGAFLAQRGAVAPYATVGCGVAGVAMFVAGLFARSRPHRLAGLAALALCVPRAFIVDLHATLHRIAAFVALGVVLLWVGFSYHRFRHLVVDEEKNPAGPEDAA